MRGKIPLTFFDDKKQILIDLDDSYEAAKKSDPPGAKRMKEARILGLLTDSYYRDLRQFDGTAVVTKLVPALKEADTLKDDIEELTTPAEKIEPASGRGGRLRPPDRAAQQRRPTWPRSRACSP